MTPLALDSGSFCSVVARSDSFATYLEGPAGLPRIALLDANTLAPRTYVQLPALAATFNYGLVEVVASSAGYRVLASSSSSTAIFDKVLQAASLDQTDQLGPFTMAGTFTSSAVASATQAEAAGRHAFGVGYDISSNPTKLLVTQTCD